MQKRFLNFHTFLGAKKWGKYRIFCKEILYLLILETAKLEKEGVHS
jgi:hypothetical protein